MAVSYSMVPSDMLDGLINVNRPTNIDEGIMNTSLKTMSKITKSKKHKTPANKLQYMAQLRNLIRTKRNVEERPKRVSIDNLETALRQLLDQQKTSVIAETPMPAPTTSSIQNSKTLQVQNVTPSH